MVASAMGVQWLPRECEVCLAERFALRRMRVDQARDILRECIPVGDQLRFCSEFADPGTDHVNADDRTIRPPHQLHETPSLEDSRLAISGEVVAESLHIAEAAPRLIFSESHGCDFRVTVGDPRDLLVVPTCRRS